MQKWIYFNDKAVNLNNVISMAFGKGEYEKKFYIAFITLDKKIFWEFEQKDMSDEEFEKDFQDVKSSIINFTNNKDSLVMILD